MDVKCLIIDDEPPARELIKTYLNRLEGFEVCDVFSNGIEAFNYIQKNQIDLLFVDIQMPLMNGIELIKSVPHGPKIIVTSAYREYAAEGFDLSILDYLVKPIVFERFLKSISKYNNSIVKEVVTRSSYEESYMFFRVDREMVKIYLKDIDYVESIQDYIKIITTNKTYITYVRIGYMDKKLPDTHFVRIHKSFIIPLEYIESYTHNSVMVKGKHLPVGRVYKQNFLSSLEISGLNI